MDLIQFFIIDDILYVSATFYAEFSIHMSIGALNLLHFLIEILYFLVQGYFFVLMRTMQSSIPHQNFLHFLDEALHNLKVQNV